MGADLTYECIGPNQYRVTLSFYRDCTGITPSFSYTINANSSCGSTSTTVNQVAGYPVEVSPLCAAQLPQSTCNGGTLPGVTQYVYEGILTLPANCADWVFSFYDCCRNAGITTLTNAASEGIYIQSTLNSIAAPCNNSPEFTTLPVPYVCAGQTYVYNHGAVDADGDSLVYTLVNAQNTSGVSVLYNAPFNGTNPMNSAPGVAINSTNGNVTMTPTASQIAVVAVRVDEYRNGVLIGSAIRDIQITVLNCTNNPPLINPITGVTGGNQTGNYSVEICPGQTLNLTIPGTDPNGGQIINWSWNNGIPGGIFTGPSGGSPQNATFTWTPTAADVGLNSLTVTLEDDACPVLGQAVRSIDILVLQGTTAGPDRTYCVSGGPVQLQAIGGSSFTWTVLSGSAGSLSCTNCSSPLATPGSTTTYMVQSNLSGACRNRDTITVSVAPSFTLAMGPAQTLCQSGSATLSVTPNPAGTYTYNWSPAGSLSASNVSNPTATPGATTTYNVTVTSAAGCTVTGSQQVTVSNSVLAAAPTASPTQSCSGAPVTLNANVTAGDCNQYTGGTIAYSPVTTGTWNSIFLSDDQVSGAVPIGFNFTFYCNTYSQAYISSNGFVTFNPASGSGCCGGQVLPNGADPNNLIAAAWDDLYPPGAGAVRYQTQGVAPNRRFIVEWSNVPFCCGTAPAVTSQAILYEGSNRIEIHSGSISSISPGTQGIENSTGTLAMTVPGRNGSTWSSAGDAYQFTPSTPLPFTVTWQAPLGTTVGTGTSISVTPSTTTTYYAVANNGICSATAPVVVSVASANAGPDVNICPAGQNVNLLATYNGPPPPSNCNLYTVTNIPFAPLRGTGTSLTLGDDQVSGAVPIGFNFTFFCNNYANLYVSSNGFLTFNGASGSGCCSGTTLPTATIDNFIAASWNDLYPPAGGTITYATNGTAPNRVFVLTYTNINHCCSAGPINTFQILLYETTNIIEIHTTTITDDGSTHTQGIQSGANFAAVPGWAGTNFTANNIAYRFSPQVGAVTYTWSPALYLTATNVANPTALNVPTDITYTVTINNGTCIMTDDVNITVCLPVESVSLTATAEGEDVRLNWTSINEQGLDRYVIERSLSNNTWEDLGQTAAHGSQGTFQYESFDREPGAGSNTYRLRLIDQNGAVNYSNLAEVTFDGRDWVTVTPNPGNGLFAMQIHAAQAGEIRIEILSADGKMVRDAMAETDASGNLRHEFDIQALPAGNYLYRVSTPTGKISGRVVKID